MNDVEDDVDRVQTVADVLPEWSNHYHWFSVCPGQVIVVVTCETIQEIQLHRFCMCLKCVNKSTASDNSFITHHQIPHSYTEWWRPVVCRWCPVCCHSYRCWPQTGLVPQVPESWKRCGRPHTDNTSSSSGTSDAQKEVKGTRRGKYKHTAVILNDPRQVSTGG